MNTFMKEPSKKRTAALGLRVKPRLKVALEKAAAADRRPVASYVENLLIDHLAELGFIEKDQAFEASLDRTDQADSRSPLGLRAAWRDATDL